MSTIALKLEEELRVIEEQTLALIGVARRRHIVDGHGRIVSSFALSDAQRALATANSRRMKGWTAALAALLRRQGRPVDDFLSTAEAFAHQVTLAQTGNAVQLESEWREECCVSVAEHAAEL
ncbi:MAG TPA: hypothetical protein VN181_16145, partial [Thermoanaerobaculia bacterium]|nr:hypothetical protein [Thermoanaerobaculia bacterium]